jgi:hypothetical protein
MKTDHLLTQGNSRLLERPTPAELAERQIIEAMSRREDDWHMKHPPTDTDTDSDEVPSPEET